MSVIVASDYPPERLRRLSADVEFAGRRSPNGVVAGLWLHWNELEEAHRVAQELSTAEGSFWHGIVHRREPDPGNAAYWFRRVGRHPVFPVLREAVAQLLAERGDRGFRLGREWDPFAWIDFWEAARRRTQSAEYALALEIQEIEWRTLMDWCATIAE
jgi:hypothetical protein